MKKKRYHYIVHWEEPTNVNTCNHIQCSQNVPSNIINIFVKNLVNRNCANIQMQICYDKERK